ncbi:alpha/beta hydrolase [Acrocarpospora corrugata]|nr:dienelactone hydrolase family protein [Acrocarpospora corrugata]
MTVKSSDADLTAGVAGEGPIGVVIANTLVGYHCDWLIWADHLAKSRFRGAVFRYGFVPRTTGVPTMLDRGSTEMTAVAGELRNLGAQKIVYARGSLGGSVALATAASPEAKAAGVISLSGGLPEQQETVGRLTVPALYVVAEDDITGGANQLATDLHKATTSTKDLLVYPGAQHAGDMFNDKRYAEELLAELNAFLRGV